MTEEDLEEQKALADSILEEAGIERDWLEGFIYHSNEIDPQPGYDNRPGSPRWDQHIEAALWCINAANCGEAVEPRDVHAILMRGFIPKPGVYRTVGVSVGRWQKPEPLKVPDLMTDWADRVDETLNADAIAEGAIDRVVIEGLHCEYENIHPWVDGNGRSGRLIMLNHALMCAVDPWIIHAGEEQQAYYAMIEEHESHARHSRDVYRDVINEIVAREFAERKARDES